MNNTATARRNTTRHFVVTDLETGETLATEKCRDTLGGWNNMVNRLAVAFGAEPHGADRFRVVDTFGPTCCTATVGGRSVRVEEFEKL